MAIKCMMLKTLNLSLDEFKKAVLSKAGIKLTNIVGAAM